MQGRLENEMKINTYIQTLLDDMPEYVSDWYIKLKASDHQARTCQTYVVDIKKYLESIDMNVKSIPIDKLTSKSVDRYMVSIKTKKDDEGLIVYTSASYQKGNWSALNNFFNYLQKEGLIKRNYMEDINRTKESDEERISENRVLLTKDDFNSIIECVLEGVGSKSAQTYQRKLRNRDMSIFLLFMTTGMRREEMREINLEDIDLVEKKLFIITKGNRRRPLNIDDTVMPYLYAWFQDRKEMDISNCDALFVNRYGKRMSGQAIYDLIDKYCTEALGYHISPHKLRSGFCSILLEEWGDIHAVMKAVGHKRVETTLRYAVTKNNEQSEGASLIGNYLFS